MYAHVKDFAEYKYSLAYVARKRHESVNFFLIKYGTESFRITPQCFEKIVGLKIWQTAALSKLTSKAVVLSKLIVFPLVGGIQFCKRRCIYLLLFSTYSNIPNDISSPTHL